MWRFYFMFMFTVVGCRALAPSETLTELNSTASFSCDISMYPHDFPFDQQTDTLDNTKELSQQQWGLLQSSAMLSRLTYETPDIIKKRGKKWGFTTTQVIESNTMLAAVFSNETCVYLAFRGTDFHSMRDWMVDANIRKKKLPSGYIHKGFFNAFMDMRHSISAALQSVDVDQKSFFVTGHSLGGALAGVYAYENSVDRLFDAKGPTIQHVVTFGQPLFADTRLAANIRSEFWGRYYRVVNGNDIVTRIPTKFRHLGSLIWIHDQQVTLNAEGEHVVFGSGGRPRRRPQKIKEAETPPELAANQAAFKEFLEASAPPSAQAEEEEMVFGGISYLDDHSMDAYLNLTQRGHRQSQR